MRSAPLGKRTSDVEVTVISKQGFWLLVSGREFFLPFDLFPWFRNAAVGDIMNVTLPHQQHLYWPSLDVDLAVDSLEYPERYPLVSGARAARSIQPASAPSAQFAGALRDQAGVREPREKYVISARKRRTKPSRRTGRS